MSVPFFVSRLVHPVHALGPGTRAGIWTQGCGIGCPGCVAQDTWGRPAGSRSDVDAVLDWLAALPWPELDGVTISGGEPTDQPAAMQALLAGIGELKADYAQVDILLYTGRSADWVLSEGRQIVEGADAIMADPFVSAQAGTLPLRGSDNQRLLALTSLGSARYVDSPLPDRHKVQVDIVDGEIRMVGIPTPGALAELTEQAEAAGLHLRGTSWRR